MNVVNFKSGFLVLLVAGILIALMILHLTQTRFGEENKSLRRQIAQLEMGNQSISNRLAAADKAKSLTDEQLNELMRLRSQIGVLQQQLGDLGKLRSENQQLRDAAATLQSSNENMAMASALARFKANEVQVVNAMKQLGIAARMYGDDNSGQYATNFDQMTNLLGALYKDPLLNGIEFVNAGVARLEYPQMIIFRESNPRQSPDGTWQRVYGLADGHVQVVVSPNGDFGAWEKYDYTEKGIILSPPPNAN